jgi:hypothetical protein
MPNGLGIKNSGTNGFLPNMLGSRDAGPKAGEKMGMFNTRMNKFIHQGIS